MTAGFSRRQFLQGLLATTAAGVMPLAVRPANSAISATAVSAIKSALAGDFQTAGIYAQQCGDPAAIKLVELLFLRDHGRDAGYARIMDFLGNAPKWPIAETMARRAEQALYAGGDKSTAVIEHFAIRKPLTPEGLIALARAQFAAGDSAAGRAALRKAWLRPDMEPGFEKSVASEFASVLTASDHKERLSHLIYAQESNAAIRQAARLGSAYTKTAKVAQALLRSAGGCEKLYEALPSSSRNDPALRYALARHYRKQEKFAKARAVLQAGPTTAEAMGDPEAWWTERRIIARRSIGPNHRDTWPVAYKIASQHGLTKGTNAVEAEFLSGWIALRYLNQPDTAMAHFATLQTIAPTRTEKARAAYWIGRTHAARGDKGDAKAAFKSAAQYTTLFYGQLAREQIGLGKEPEKISLGEATAAARSRVDNDEVIRAFRLMNEAGAKQHLYWFLWSIATRFDNADDMNAAAAVIHSVGGTSMALKFAKAASQRNIDIDAWSYPIRGLPDWNQIGKPVEKALVYGLSRQESEFDPQAGSKVGAQGLMQLMPGTAKIVARQYGLAYAPAKLKGDPAYNVKLGAAHLADLVQDFNGSYVLTLVAYNAGPRRAREWVEEFGDLRNGQVDPVDWVESIPFNETRQYVQKVLQNLHIYRSRLAPHTVKPMLADLRRGQPVDITVASTSAAPDRSCSGGSIAGLIRGCD